MDERLSAVCYGLLLGGALLVGGYFSFRYFLLRKALREMAGDLREIGRSVEQNRILRLPVPHRTLEELMASINDMLEEIRRERLRFERREREFQEQIENVSHDLRTPLTVILGYLKIMKRQCFGCGTIGGQAAEPENPMPKTMEAGKNMPETAEILEIIERNARTMERLVSQFYAYSQASSNDCGAELEEVDVCRELKEILADNYQLVEKLRLTARLPEHPVTVRGNKAALERIFLNLLQNAGRYAHSFLDIYIEEGNEGTVHMEKAEDGKEGYAEEAGDNRPLGAGVRVVMTNDAPGITEEAVSHIFDRFYRYDKSRSEGGSGLGLAIARSLAERLGGSLTAEMTIGGQGDADVPADPAKQRGPEEGPAKAGGCAALCFVLTLKGL